MAHAPPAGAHMTCRRHSGGKQDLRWLPCSDLAAKWATLVRVTGANQSSRAF